MKLRSNGQAQFANLTTAQASIWGTSMALLSISTEYGPLANLLTNAITKTIASQFLSTIV